MEYISLEKLSAKCDSHFKLVLCAAERANEILRGDEPIVEYDSKKPTTLALNEVAEGKVYYKHES